jgi:predicted MFS family arabinose efflux permease
MIFADWMRAFIVLGMLFVRSAEWVWFLYVLLFLETIMWALFEPGRGALVPTIAPEEDRIVANSLSSVTWSFNLAVGSALGGFVAAVWGRDTVFVVNAVSFLASALLLQRMRVEEPHLRDLPPLKARDLADFTPIVEGVRYVRRDARMLATLFVKCGLGLMGTNWVILTIFGERVFPVAMGGFGPSGAGMLGMSFLMGSRGVGALLGPLIGSYWAGHDESRLRRGILYGFLVGACGYFALAWAPTLPLACLAVVVAHCGGSTIWVFSTTLLQAQVEDRFRGRVFSAEFAFSMLSMSTVSYLAGVLIDGGYGVRTLAAMTGAIVLGPALAWSFALALWRQTPPSQPEDRPAGLDASAS